MSIEQMGIDYVELNEMGEVIAIRGKFKTYKIERNDNVYNWAIIGLDYMGG